MAVGRPVIGTRVCGLDETVDDGVTGRLVAAEDFVALSTAILDVLSDPATAARYGAAGRRRYEASFTARLMTEQTNEVFAELLLERAGTDAADQLASDGSVAPVLADAG
jgi:starch synthase